MKKALLTTPNGERFVVLPEADYERLLELAEDAADIAAYDRVKGRLARGEEEMIPAEIVNRLIDSPESHMRSGAIIAACR